MSDVRETCEHCGLPVATEEDGEVHYQDPAVALFCWSNEKNGTLCKKDPNRPKEEPEAE